MYWFTVTKNELIIKWSPADKTTNGTCRKGPEYISTFLISILDATWLLYTSDKYIGRDWEWIVYR